MAEYAALLGVDWSDHKHELCIIEAATGKREAVTLSHSPQAIEEWAAALRARFGGRPVATRLEQSRGPLIYALLKYDFLTLYPVNPRTLPRGPRTTLARFREDWVAQLERGGPPVRLPLPADQHTL